MIAINTILIALDVKKYNVYVQKQPSAIQSKLTVTLGWLIMTWVNNILASCSGHIREGGIILSIPGGHSESFYL